MGQTIISAIGVYISTSIDFLIILIILFAQLSQNKQKWHIYAGQYLGTGLLVGASLVAAYVVNFVPEPWMVGLLGLIPIYLGIRFAIVGEGEEEGEEEIIERLEQSKANQLFWTVTLLTIASGGDNLVLISQDFTTQTIRLTDFLPAVFLLYMTFQKREDLSFSSGTFIANFP